MNLIAIHGHIENDWPAADLAVFEVILMRNGRVKQDMYALATVGAGDAFFMEVMHSGFRAFNSLN